MIRGEYFDGRTAAAHSVTVDVLAEGLVLTKGDGDSVSWPIPLIAIADQDSRSIRLQTREAPPQLLIAPSELCARIAAIHPGFGEPSARVLWRNLALLSLPALLAGLSLVRFGLPMLARTAAWLVPVAVEERMGESIASAFTLNMECSGGTAQEAIRQIVDKLASTMNSPYRYRVRIVNRDTMNALAAPGGHIVVFRGLIERTQSAEELAAVLAHEMQHVAQRHGTSAVIRSLGLTAAVSVFIGDPTFLITAGALLSELQYHRDDEESADFVALIILHQARIDAVGMVRVLRLLSREQRGESGVARYLSTHPVSQERIAMAEREASTPSREPIKLLPGEAWPPAIRCP